MGRTIETGHAVNLSNCKLLIDTCNSFGASYHAGITDRSITNLTTQWTTGTTGQKAYIAAFEGIRQPINTRKKLFAGILPLLTRVLGELNITKADAKRKAEVKTIADELRGSIPPATKGAAGSKASTISHSHAGYVQCANNFLKLAELLNTIPEYAPKKDFLKIPALYAVYANMNAVNNGIGAALHAADNALLQRNHALYKPETGIVDSALRCKEYVKGVYGSSSTEYKMISRINFRSLV